MKKMTAKSWLMVAVLIVTGVVTRWVPHPPNFSALMAVALFAGYAFSGPLALAIPLASAFLGDLFLGFHDLMAVVYLSLLVMVAIGRWLPELDRRVQTWAGWALNGLVGSVFFFLTTNFAVWWTSGMYPHTQEGLTSCFVLGIPFFHNSVISTWLFLGVFEAVRRLVAAPATRKVEA